MNKKAITVRLLEKLKSDRHNLTESNSFGFASKTIDLIKLSVGNESELFKTMNVLFYDRTMLNAQESHISAQQLIVHRINNINGIYDSIINSCIETVNNYGLYKHPCERKNVLGDLDNSMIYTVMGIVFTVSFSMGVVATKFGISKIFDPNENRENVQTTNQKQAQKDTLLPVQQKKSRINLKE